MTISSVLPVMVVPNAPLAARTERSTSADVALTRELTSLDAATRAVCALSALVWILSVVLAVTAPSDRSMSAEIALIWFALPRPTLPSAKVAPRARCSESKRRYPPRSPSAYVPRRSPAT